jgi:cephalosporin hydroxylase
MNDEGSPDRPVTYPGLHGLSWLSRSELAWMIDQLPADGLFLEIGTASGVSAAVIAQARPELTILCVDTFVDKDHPNVAENDPERLSNWHKNRQPNMILWYGNVLQFQRLQPRWEPNVILVDGDHSRESVLADLEAANVLLTPGGLVFVHDYGEPDWPEVKIAVDRYFMDPDWYEVIGQHWTMLGLRDRS